MSISFPPGFLLGTATSAYQIEGAVTEDGRGPSIWDTFSHTPGKVYRGDTGDIACDHYHRLESDLDLMASLGYRSYRFSIAWPRVLPAGQGQVNQRGLDFYRRLLSGLHDRGIVPMVTLYHWDLPQALQDAGGWPARDTAARFADYAAVVAAELGDLVPLWITLNEPWVSAFAGHLQGRHAPGAADLSTALRAAHHLLLGHGLAVAALRAGRGTGQVGITLNLADVAAGSSDPADVAAAERIDGQANRWFLDPVLRGRYPADLLAWYQSRADVSVLTDGAQAAADLAVAARPLDFLGINFYDHQQIVASDDDPVYGARRRAYRGPVTHASWPVEPAALGRVLRRVTREYGPLPLYVTENGACYYDYVDPGGRVNDIERVDYLDGYLGAAAEAISSGVDLRGYYAWSFLDNFEWARGYLPRFGLVYVDYRTQERIPKASARWYADLIASQPAAVPR
jgi:beta-glucosidase